MNMTPEQFVAEWNPNATDYNVGGFNKIRERQDRLIVGLLRMPEQERAVFVQQVSTLFVNGHNPMQAENLHMRLVNRKAG